MLKAGDLLYVIILNKILSITSVNHCNSNRRSSQLHLPSMHFEWCSHHKYFYKVLNNFVA